MSAKLVAFIEAYEAALKQRYEWAKDPLKLSTYMKGVGRTLKGTSLDWNVNGDALVHACKALGIKGKPSLKKLRAFVGYEVQS